MEELLNEEPVLTEEEAGFFVDDDQKAEWCLEKIREANAEKEKWTAFYMERLKAICDREDRRIAYMEEKLKFYFSMVPHKESKTQESYQLPGGKLIRKRQSPEISRDDSVIIQWLYDNSQRPEEYLDIKETLKWAELKKVLIPAGSQMATMDGEIVPGIIVSERPEKFVVEVKA